MVPIAVDADLDVVCANEYSAEKEGGSIRIMLVVRLGMLQIKQRFDLRIQIASGGKTHIKMNDVLSCNVR